MDFTLPAEITVKLAELDAFIEAEIKPLERENKQFFDHRREYARTDWENDGRPHPKWRAVIEEMERRADTRRPPAPGPAQELRRSCRLQPDDRRDPRASGGQGPGPAQRPAGRESHRRQFPHRAGDRRLRHAGTEEIHRGHHHQQDASELRPHRARPRQRRHLDGHHRRAGHRRLGRLDHQRHEALEQPGCACPRQPRVCTHLGQAGRREGHHRVHRAHRCARPQDPVQPLDLQHAQRPRRDRVEGRARARQRDPAQGRRRV